jgi:predicted glycoside hydrolase/deacetylase ChbG (UPF0249 family)
LRALVVTADDAGLHPGTTLGALEAHDRGLVTAVSVVAGGAALELALEQIRDRPGLDAGVHLTLVGERPLSPPGEVPSLLGRGGAFLPHVRDFALRYALGGIAAAEVEAELRRQIERLLAGGLTLVHANSHQHLHVLPRIFDVVLRLAGEYRIPFVRIPREPAAGRRISGRSLEIAVLNAVGRGARRRLGSGGIVRAADRTVGVMDAGRLTPERLEAVLADVGEGVSELVCHPGLGNRELAAAYPSWGYGWEAETAALCDPRLPDLLRALGIQLTSFSGLSAAARP